MKMKNLLLVSTIFVTACAQNPFEQEPAPFQHSGAKVFHKNGAQTLASHEVGNDNVSYIDSSEDYYSASAPKIRTKSLAPVTSRNDDTVHLSSNSYADDSRSQQLASTSKSFVVKPKPVYDRPIRGEEAAKPRYETKPGPASTSRSNSDYLDLSKVQTFESAPNASAGKLAGINPIAKPEYNKIETASGKQAKITAPKPVKVATPKPAEKVIVKEVAAAKEIEVREEPLIVPVIEQPATKPMAISSGRFLKPIDGQIISQFGDRSDGTFNDGINIKASEGAPVKAAAGGSVVYSGNQLQGYGNLIIIRHEDGYLTAYAHLKELELKKGESIGKGDIIGKVGKTGNVDQPQLHFGVRKGREPVNPVDFL